MDWMIWIGAAMTLAGVAGLAWCILQAVRAKARGLDDAAMRAALQRVVAVNVGALAVSALGLMMVVVGVLLA